MYLEFQYLVGSKSKNQFISLSTDNLDINTPCDRGYGTFQSSRSNSSTNLSFVPETEFRSSMSSINSDSTNTTESVSVENGWTVQADDIRNASANIMRGKYK